MRTLFDSDDPWVDFHRRMHHEMMRFHQIADNILNMQNAQNMMPNIAIHRPQGHEDKALEGNQIQLPEFCLIWLPFLEACS